MKKINDFGQKIGGAKKDLWAMFHELPETEQNALAKRDKIWKRPDYYKLKDSGIAEEVLFWRNEMRKAVKPRPDANPEGYVKFVMQFMENVEACQSLDNVEAFYHNKDDGGIFQIMDNVEGNKWRYQDAGYKCFVKGNEILKYVYHTSEKIIADCCTARFLKDENEYRILQAGKDNSKFGEKPDKNGLFRNCVVSGTIASTFYSETNLSEMLKDSEDGTIRIVIRGNKRIGIFKTQDEAEAAVAADKEKNLQKTKEKKSAFLPPHLTNIERTGSNYRFFRVTDGNVLLARYGLRGGEFGNYTTAKDRLGSLNMAYDALEDLYNALDISPKDISLGGKLAIAFGARGRGNAMAHYEPDRNVINMTKMRGAGSLAHEWGHALDAYLGEKFGCHGFMSANMTSDKIPESARKLVDSFTEQNGSKTNFLTGSEAYDKTYRRSGNGYWTSKPEMLARAFACYVKDKLDGRKSDYLVGHAECAVGAYPVGAEREYINSMFDAMFAELKEMKIFSENSEKEHKKEKGPEQSNIVDVVFFEDSQGQLRFC